MNDHVREVEIVLTPLHLISHPKFPLITINVSIGKLFLTLQYNHIPNLTIIGKKVNQNNQRGSKLKQ